MPHFHRLVIQIPYPIWHLWLPILLPVAPWVPFLSRFYMQWSELGRIVSPSGRCWAVDDPRGNLWRRKTCNLQIGKQLGNCSYMPSRRSSLSLFFDSLQQAFDFLFFSRLPGTSGASPNPASSPIEKGKIKPPHRACCQAAFVIKYARASSSTRGIGFSWGVFAARFVPLHWMPPHRTSLARHQFIFDPHSLPTHF